MSQQKAQEVIDFIGLLKHTTGKWAGHPFILEPWQEEIIRDIFGTLNKDGKRQYRQAYLEIPRKNGKSSFAATMALAVLFLDGEPGAEIYSAANDREQASLVYRIAAQMVRQNPTLRKRCKILDSTRRIIYPEFNSFYRAIPAEAAGAHGFNAHCVIYDELHAASNRDLWDVLTTSMGAREQPLLIMITTAGFDQNSICYEMHEYAKGILNGTIQDDTFYARIYAADQSDDWTKPATWRKANPNLGISVSEHFLAQEARRALQIPAYQNTFKRLYLNIWTQQEDRWLDLAAWDDTAGLVVPERLKGRPCYAGLDLSSTTDITALVLVFPMEDGRFEVIPTFWIPEADVLDRERRDRVPYSAWIRQGLIKTTPGEVIDYDFVIKEIESLGNVYDIREIAYDRWGAAKVRLDLEGAGFVMVEFGQGYSSMSAPTKELLRQVLAKTLTHGGNPVLRWMADCMTVSQDAAGNIKPVKPDRRRSGKRIDGIVALIMALDRATKAGYDIAVGEFADDEFLSRLWGRRRGEAL